jgi:dCTP diphosphatase
MLPNDLTSELLEFRNERDWEQFHTPRNLSAAICTEAAELLEHFRWARDTELASIVEKNRELIAQEIPDVARCISPTPRSWATTSC